MNHGRSDSETVGMGSIPPPTDPRDLGWPGHYDDRPTRDEAEADERDGR